MKRCCCCGPIQYPGNVRELENLVERAVMLTKGNLILPEAFKDVLDPASGRESLPAMTASTFKKSRAQTLAMFEKKILT